MVDVRRRHVIPISLTELLWYLVANGLQLCQGRKCYIPVFGRVWWTLDQNQLVFISPLLTFCTGTRISSNYFICLWLLWNPGFRFSCSVDFIIWISGRLARIKAEVLIPYLKFFHSWKMVTHPLPTPSFWDQKVLELLLTLFLLSSIGDLSCWPDLRLLRLEMLFSTSVPQACSKPPSASWRFQYPWLILFSIKYSDYKFMVSHFCQLFYFFLC